MTLPASPGADRSMATHLAREDALSAHFVLEYPYTRSTGPVIGSFLGALREQRILGVRTRDGKVIVPPTEYDPDTGEHLEELVEVGQSGVVVTWCWVYEPRPNHPLGRPFAWALIRLDGADTGLLHAIDCGDESRMRSGMRVRARWREERWGEIRDIACFERCVEGGRSDAEPKPSVASEPVRIIRTPSRLAYNFTPGAAQSRFLRQVARGRLFGQRCSECGKVYVPPRGACPTCGLPTAEEVEVADSGTVTTFCIVNLPFSGQAVEVPYACAFILLDGADIPLFHMLQEVPVAEVRMGMRVKAVWDEEPKPTLESIKYFRPSGEPDALYESYKDHL